MEEAALARSPTYWVFSTVSSVHHRQPLAPSPKIAVPRFLPTLFLALGLGLWLSLPSFTAQGAERPSRSYAVVVGIGDYFEDTDPRTREKASFSRLTYASQDAKDVSRVFEQGGYSVKTLVADPGADPRDAKRLDASKIERALRAYSKLAQPGDRLVFYFSGHGARQERRNSVTGEIEARAYLCPQTASPLDLGDTALDMQVVHRILRDSKATEKLAIIDARRNTLATPRGGLSDFEPEERRLEMGVRYLFSTEGASFAFEPTSREVDRVSRPGEAVLIRNGIFTHFFLQALEKERSGGGEVQLEGVFSRLKRAVARHGASLRPERAQVPALIWRQPMGSDSGRGDMVLIPELARPQSSDGTGRPGSGTRTPAWATLIAEQPDPSVITDPSARLLIQQEVERTGLPWWVRDRETGIDMLLVPGGEYRRGLSPGDAEGRKEGDEEPSHTIRVKPFYLGRTEVSVAQWRAFVEAAEYRTDAEEGDGGFTLVEDRKDAWLQRKDAVWSNPLPGQSEYHLSEEDPVSQVSWNDVSWFCSEFGFRLPRESEWEYACRAGTLTIRWWGDGLEGGEGAGNFSDSADGHSVDPGEAFPFDDGYRHFAPVNRPGVRGNPWGFVDMIGNVSEWCSTSYQARSYARCAGGADAESDDRVEGEPRVLRGGSWYFEPRYCRSGSRSCFDPFLSFCNVGFRVARTP